MNGSLLDTNVIIKCIQGDKDAETLLNKLENTIYISATVVGELFFGAYKSKRTIENLKIFNEFIACYNFLSVTDQIAETYGKVKANLSARGITIPENDVWIAATALAHDLRLATFDAHFAKVEGLVLEK